MSNLLWKILTYLLGAAYIISPIDALPDLLLPVGFIDDLLVLVLVIWLLKYRFPQKKVSGDQRSEQREAQESRSDDPYLILGVDRMDSREKIERAYKRLVAKYHPDKVTHLGKEFQKLAHQRFIEIQGAYRQTRKERE